MTFTLRTYQQTCHDKLTEYLKTSTEPCLIDAAPAAGKSYLIAAIADFLYRVSNGKRVLCLAPSSELIHQNAEKYRLTGEPCSIFSASAGAKSTKHKVVFATPLTVKNSISRFKACYAGVVIDECHGITPTIRDIIDQMKQQNPMLRVIGFSGTPYRLGDGFIYRIGPDGRSLGDDVSKNPYFMKCVHRVSAREMLDQGFITPMKISATGSEHYDTSGLSLNRLGQWNADEVDRAFVGHGRKTAAIVADVISRSRPYEGGVMLFAATVRHAEEVYASLPPELSGMVTGETEDRKAIIKAYREKRIRYLVSVGTLTTGFDVPHTQVIALLRKTESAALLTQILGRAWRLHDDKSHSVVMDYAGNIESHFPDGDIFNPVIKASTKKEAGNGIKAECPECNYENIFSCQEQYKDYPIDENGYCVDVFGSRIETEYGPLSAHHGRRCLGYVPAGQGKLDRCSYRWAGKPCPQCEELNDIAARYCYVCKAELVDPNEKLQGEFKAMKRDPHLPQCDDVLSMECKPTISRSGRETLRVDWVTPHRQFSVWFTPGKEEHDRFMKVTDNGNVKPATVGYRKVDDKFYKIHSYNLASDEPERVDKFKRVG